MLTPRILFEFFTLIYFSVFCDILVDDIVSKSFFEYGIISWLMPQLTERRRFIAYAQILHWMTSTNE